ncbi:unnamed protein product [Rotaria sp. Silwood1]|nr:unnamed protein product [Rotaria sp. Silwood1]
MKAIPTDKNELIDLSEKEYTDNTNELAIVHEFQESYSPDRSLWWYTRESFLYRKLNKALRTLDIDVLFAFRFFIRDIHEQLERYRCSSPIRIYRGQLMATNELEMLKASIGQLISMNSFLSTTTNRRAALSFLYSSTLSDNLERVLFQIEANPHLDGVKPFAGISSLSYFPDEDEVLLMLGSILRLVSIDVGERGVSIIRSTLCSNSDHDVQAVFDYVKKQYGDAETTTLSFGIVLGLMGKYNEAEKYIRRLIKELPSDHEDIAACYHDLGEILDKKGDYDSSLQIFLDNNFPLFRFFIRDIHEQLERYRCSSPIRIYRGQLMATNELEMLKASIGQLISMNSFLSTTTNRRAALSFLYSSNLSDNLECVLFQIDANPHLDGVKPFADISSLSYFPDEDEVLLMLGSILRLVSIDVDERGVSIIRSTLCSNSDHDVQAVFDYVKKQYGDAETTTLSFGLVLGLMGKYNEAEKYIRRLLKELPSDHEDIAACYHDLGEILDKKGDYDSSLQSHQKALEIMLQTRRPDHPDIGTSYNSIAAVQVKTGNYTQALESFRKAFEIWRQAFGEDHPNIAFCLSNMAGIYQISGKYAEGLDSLKLALRIRQHHLPANHPDIADTHNNIGLLYFTLDQLDLAIEHFNMSLKIKQICLPPNHSDIAMTLSNMSLVYEQKEEFNQALSYLQRAANICHQTLEPTHPYVLHIEQLIQRVSSKLK